MTCAAAASIDKYGGLHHRHVLHHPQEREFENPPATKIITDGNLPSQHFAFYTLLPDHAEEVRLKSSKATKR